MTELPNNLDTILHIGAGRGEEIRVYLNSNAKRILLVEPNPNLAARLRAWAQRDSRVIVVETAITDDPAQNQLTEYNLPEAASLFQPTGLRQSFPGLRTTAQHPVTTSSLQQLLDQYPPGKGNNLLVLQAPGAELSIIKALAVTDNTEPFSHVWLTCPHDAYYSTASRASDALAALERQGYEVRAAGAEHDDWPEWQLVCNPLARKVQFLDVEKQALTDALQQSKSELDATKQELEASETARRQAEAKQQEAEKRANQLIEKLKKLEEQVATTTKNQPQFTELQKRMEHLFDQQRLQLEQAANALGRHVTSTAHNTAKELEAGFQLQQQLGADFASLEQRDSRLPSTVALQLSRQLKTQPYDLIIEMGSGVTTSFLAHTLRKRAESQSEDKAESTSVTRYVEPSDDDLPKRILCFEHNRATVTSLQETLKQSGLAPIITLQHAPLVNRQHQGNEYLFYDCGSRLRQIAQLFENRTARVFILLNDVAGDSRPDRIVALPQVLQYLSAHSLDIMINNTQTDSNLIIQWQQLLESRGLEYQPAASFGNSNTQLMRINP